MTSNAVSAGKTSSKSSTPKFFLFNKSRRPQFGVKATWDKGAPDDDEIGHSDFISSAFLTAEKITLSASLDNNLTNLNQFLLPYFFKASQQAKYFQNTYYWFQWVTTIGALLTTVVAAFAVVATVSPSSPAQLAAFSTILMALLGFITTASGAFGTIMRPQENWFTFRSIAEELRRQYFLYFSNLIPYDGAKPFTTLQKQVIQIYYDDDPSDKLHVSDQNTGLMVGKPESKARLSPQDIRTLCIIYQKRRIERQAAFYESRIGEFKLNWLATSALSIVLIGAASFIGIFNTVDPRFILAYLSAILPSGAVLFLSFQQIYDWNRQEKLYSDALRQLKLIQTDCDEVISACDSTDPDADPLTLYASLVSRAESTFQSEMGQWGQPIFARAAATVPLTTQEIIEKLIEAQNLPPDKADQLRALLK